MTPSIQETVERLREEAVNAHKQPSWVDPYFMDDTAALIERLAGALEGCLMDLEAFHKHGRVAGPMTQEENYRLESARRALSGKD